MGFNTLELRITIIFRGSVTRADFVAGSFIKSPKPNKFDGAPINDVDEDVSGASWGNDDGVGIHQGILQVPLRREGWHVEQVRRDKEYHEAIAHGGSREGEVQAVRHGTQPVGGHHKIIRILRVNVSEPAVAGQGRLRDITTGGEHRVRAIVCRARESRWDTTPTHHKSQESCDVQIHHKRPRYVGQTSPFGYMLLLYVGNCKGMEEIMYFQTGIKLK
jgi:hypothetical protein